MEVLGGNPLGLEELEEIALSHTDESEELPLI